MRVYMHIHARRVFASNFMGPTEQPLPSRVKNSNLTAFTGRSISPQTTRTWQRDKAGFAF